jgi:DNA repair exonuclease SbcCD ATPase subunit
MGKGFFSREIWALAVGLGVLLSPGAASADKVSDFKDAKGKTGCASIPYSDLSRNCSDQQNGVNDWCKGGRGPVTCTGIDTRKIRDDIDRAERKLDDLKRELSSLQSKRSSAKDDAEKRSAEKEIDEKEKAIDTAKRSIEQLKKDLEDARKQIQQIISTIDKCIDYREAVMNIFSSARDKLSGETDEAIKDIARELRNAYSESISGHRQAITDKQNAKSACKDRL